MFRKLQCNYLLPWLRDCCVGAAGFRGWVTPRLSQELSRCMNLKVKGRTWPRHGENFPPARRTELPDRKLLGLCWGMTYESQQEVNKVSERNILIRCHSWFLIRAFQVKIMLLFPIAVSFLAVCYPSGKMLAIQKYWTKLHPRMSQTTRVNTVTKRNLSWHNRNTSKYTNLSRLHGLQPSVLTNRPQTHGVHDNCVVLLTRPAPSGIDSMIPWQILG